MQRSPISGLRWGFILNGHVAALVYTATFEKIEHNSPVLNGQLLLNWFDSMALLPGLNWIAASPHRRRFAIALGVVVLLSGSMASAYYPPPGVWADCCQWIAPSGICWRIGWWRFWRC